jgi:type II secretory pathway predicted ATPase ExeA
MYGEMINYYGLVKDLDKVEYFENDEFSRIMNSLNLAVNSGGIIALTGIVGSGKTTLMRKFKHSLIKDNKTVVSKSLATDKRRVSINTLYVALFSDLPTEKGFKIPTQPEKRERKLQELIRKINKPIVLIIDEAHDLHWRTLIGLKHLVETVEDANGILSVVVVGHPKLGNELKRPAMEEIGARSKLFNIEGFGENKIKFINWIFSKCSKPNTKVNDIITKEAINLLADRLITPLQIIHYLTQSLNKGFKTNTKPVIEEIIESVLSPDLETLEPNLSRHGYNLKSLCEYLDARPKDVKSYFRGQLDQIKTTEFNREVNKLGIL